MGFGIYIHIPFCQSKCFYCDFNSAAGQERWVEPYLAQLEYEAEHYALDPRVKGRRVQTVFVGGGTPTVLSAEQLLRLSQSLQAHFDLAADCEWTVEANPKTLTSDKLHALRAVGVNRLSLGVQVMDDCLLRRIGRIHTVTDVKEQVEIIRKAGFANLNMDLIYALPGQTLADWQATLSAALALGPDHLSVYGLKVEEGTPFATWQAAGELQLPSEDDEVAMYHAAQQTLREADFHHYEISNWARPGKECRHNLLYWGNQEYLGLGAGAYSFLNHHRFAHERSVETYLQRWQTENKPPVSEDEALDPDIEMAETVIMGLRRLDGIMDTEFMQRFDCSMFDYFAEPIARLTKRGLLRREDGVIRLTQDAILLSNQVFVEFIP